MSLLTQAKKVKLERIGRKSDYSAEDLELVLAWMHGEVTTKQVTEVKKFKSTGQIYTYLACCLKVYLEEGLISIKNGKG